jgi:hypothetical protein
LLCCRSPSQRSARPVRLHIAAPNTFSRGIEDRVLRNSPRVQKRFLREVNRNALDQWRKLPIANRRPGRGTHRDHCSRACTAPHDPTSVTWGFAMRNAECGTRKAPLVLSTFDRKRVEKTTSPKPVRYMWSRGSRNRTTNHALSPARVSTSRGTGERGISAADRYVLRYQYIGAFRRIAQRTLQIPASWTLLAMAPS